jgi:hypothetical protein
MKHLQDNFDWSRNDGVPDLGNAIVLLWNGFEPRSTALVRHANASAANKVFILKFADSQFDLSENDKCLDLQLDQKKAFRVDVDRGSQFRTYQTIRTQIAESDPSLKIVFDITCFPRDVLLLILYVLWSLSRLDQVVCVYNVAKDYSTEQSEISKKWLSKGVSSVSPVIGFRGVLRPDRPLQVVGLVGFDDQRVTQIADILSPSSLVFAHGDTQLKEREWLVSQGKDAVGLLLNRFDESRQDTFICEDGQSVSAMLDRARAAKPDYNLVIVPMNNKISTLFAATYCLKSRDVQICYGGALIYNHSHYSEESDKFFHWTAISEAV